MRLIPEGWAPRWSRELEAGGDDHRSRPLLSKALAWTVSVWIVHAILRLAVLARPDAFGAPFVGKLDWYLFHAWSFDARWIFLWSLPFVAHVAFWERRAPRWSMTGLVGLRVLHSVLLVLTVCDHEMQRFMGAHLTPTLVLTYGNIAAMEPLFSFLADDRGGRFLPLVLLFGSVPAAFGVAALLRRAAAFGERPRWRTVALSAFLFVVAGWIFTEVAWGGYNRARKLDPVVAVWWRAFGDAAAPSALPASEFARLRTLHRERWRAEAGPDSLWDFPDSSLPYWRVPRGGESIAAPEERWNIVLVVLESHRGLNCGFLRDHGAVRDATPFLDTIAPQGEVWTGFTVSAMPTVRALTSMHLGILDHPHVNIVTGYPGISNRSFASILGEHGWTTRFFSAADPAWDNQTPWLRQWYQATDYSRFRENDSKMFTHAARWMRDSLSAGKPFLVTLMTKTNHYPFNPVEGVEPVEGDDLQDRMVSTMRYAERSLAAFVDSLRSAPWFSRTVFVFTGDHGFPLGEHGCNSMGCGLFDESTWVPLVVWGPHPSLRPGRKRTGVASQVDIGPTLLSLAGVRAANHFTGHDLLSVSDSSRPTRIRLSNHYDEMAVADDSVRVHGTVTKVLQRPWGRQAFRRRDDPLEARDAWATDSVRFDSMLSVGAEVHALQEAILKRDALAPPRSR